MSTLPAESANSTNALLEEVLHNPLLWLLAYVPPMFAAATLEVGVVRRRAGADGLRGLRDDAEPVTAPSAVSISAHLAGS